MAIKIPAIAGEIIHIGRAGENLATTITFNVKEWLDEFGREGTFTLFVKQSGDYYLQVLKESLASRIVNNTVEWEVTNANTATVGLGKCELAYTINETIVKSVIYDIVVTTSLDVEASGEIPTPIESWLNEVSQMTDEIAHAADYAEESEQWARGTIHGVEVPSTHAGYQDNAKYYLEQTTILANKAAQWATGNTTGTPSSVNNSKYFCLQAERWAVGNENGIPVTSGNGYHNNAKYYANRIQSLNIGTVITGNPGSTAAADVVLNTTNNTLTLNLTIPRGEQGYGLKIIDTKATVNNLPSASSAGAGTAYGVGTSPPYNIYISRGVNSGGTYNGWVNYGSISGTTASLITWTA